MNKPDMDQSVRRLIAEVRPKGCDISDQALAWLRPLHEEFVELRTTVQSLKDSLATRDKWMHSRFGFVPKEGEPTKCACAYCTGDVEALADHAADMEMQLFLPGGFKDRAEKAEAELAAASEELVMRREADAKVGKGGHTKGPWRCVYLPGSKQRCAAVESPSEGVYIYLNVAKSDDMEATIERWKHDALLITTLMNAAISKAEAL